MALGLGARSIVLTGANRGIGLELVRQLLAAAEPPQWIFACSREPDGERAKVGRMAALNPLSVLVTGSNRGLGLELVKQLVRGKNPPKKIFATCRDPEGTRAQDLRNLAREHKQIEIIPLVVYDPASVKAAVTRVTEQLGGSGLNLLINNAGMAKVNTMESETREDMMEVYETNVIGPLMVSQALMPLIKKAAQESAQKGMSCSKAAIINMSSEGGSITNVLLFQFGEVACYRCSKAALNMLTKCQSLKYAEDKILCVALHPGWVQTDMGGISATLTVDQSVKDILNTLSKLSENDTGTFVNWEGKAVPW